MDEETTQTSTAELPELMTSKQVAELLQVPASTLAWYRREGRGLPFRKIGRHVRYRRRDVLHWMSTGSLEGAPAEADHAAP